MATAADPERLSLMIDDISASGMNPAEPWRLLQRQPPPTQLIACTGLVETGEPRFIFLLIITGLWGELSPSPLFVSPYSPGTLLPPFLIVSEQQHWRATAGRYRCDWLKPIRVPFSVELSLWTLVEWNTILMNVWSNLFFSEWPLGEKRSVPLVFYVLRVLRCL